MDSKKRITNRFRLKTALAFSLLIHALLVGLLWYAFSTILRPAGEGDYSFVAVSLVSEPNTSGTPNPASELDAPSFVRRGEGGGRAAPPQPSPYPSTTLRTGKGEGGDSGEGGTSETLRQIRTKIERAKFYPLMAKRQNIEGAPVVEFQIQNDGSVQNVQLKQTSGSEILDEAAVQTIKQASPLPFYPDPISLSIRYALGGR